MRNPWFLAKLRMVSSWIRWPKYRQYHLDVSIPGTWVLTCWSICIKSRFFCCSAYSEAGWWNFLHTSWWMGQRNPAKITKRMVEIPRKSWDKSWDVYHRYINWCRISLAHPPYGFLEVLTHPQIWVGNWWRVWFLHLQIVFRDEKAAPIPSAKPENEPGYSAAMGFWIK